MNLHPKDFSVFCDFVLNHEHGGELDVGMWLPNATSATRKKSYCETQYFVACSCKNSHDIFCTKSYFVIRYRKMLYECQ